MKLLDNILYIEFSEMEACDVSRRTILSWDNIKDPTDRRKVLIHYESLGDKYKAKIVKRFGDPYLYVHNQLIKQYLKIDFEAQDYFIRYRYNGNSLPAEKIKEYVTCANWLNLVIEVESNWSKCKKVLCMDTKPELYDAVVKIFEAEVIKLPKTYQTLKRKLNDYKAEKYACLISDKWGNVNSKKVKDELSTAILLSMLDHHQGYDDKYIASQYNFVALQKGFKTITAVTVGNYRHKNGHLITSGREGNAAWNNTYGKIIHQDRPSAPLMLINSDDNDLDLYFQEVRKVLRKKKDKYTGLVTVKEETETYYYHRPVMYVVMDSFNDYPLGYAVGDTINTELVYAAYRDAANHVIELTGDHYLWHQIKTDHWNLKVLKPFFGEQATFTPAAAKNARGKVIEQAFGDVWHQKLKQMYPTNYKGHNINAKTKANTEALEANKKFFPLKQQAPADVARFINELRHLKGQSGKTRQQEWVDAFNSMQQKHKRKISAEQHFMLFGQDHKHPKTGEILTNKLTNGGLIITVNGRKLVYEVPEERYLDTIGLNVHVKYDPYDMSRVLAVSSDERTRVVCHSYQNMPMAIADYQPGTRTELNSRLDERKGHVGVVGASREERQAILQRNRLNAESLLGAGVITKELKYEAERLLVGGFTEDIEHDEIEVPKRSILDRM